MLHFDHVGFSVRTLLLQSQLDCHDHIQGFFVVFLKNQHGINEKKHLASGDKKLSIGLHNHGFGQEITQLLPDPFSYLLTGKVSGNCVLL